MEKELLIEADYYYRKAKLCSLENNRSMFNYADGILQGIIKSSRILKVSDETYIKLLAMHAELLSL